MTEAGRIAERIRTGQRFVVTSHQRADGDSVGSAFSAALALQALGKSATVVFDAPPPAFLQPFPGVATACITEEVHDAFDAALVMECGTLDRTGIRGLDRSPVINIDHHPGNTHYGEINWVDQSAAACGELVFTLIETLGVPLDRAMATHLYLALLTDTGSFHFSHITPRTFEIAKRAVAAGADPQWIARTHYDSSSLARVRIFGAVLNGMQVERSGRVAVLTITERMAAEAGGTYDDTEGIINFPLSVPDLVAVAFLKEQSDGEWRVSLRSKGDVDVGSIARRLEGGGHTNASGCAASGARSEVEAFFMARLLEAVDTSS